MCMNGWVALEFWITAFNSQNSTCCSGGFWHFICKKKKSDVKLIFCFSVSSFFSVCFSGKIFFFNSFKNHQIHLVLFLFLIFTGISKLCIFRQKYFLSLLRNCVGFTSTCSFYVLGVSCGLVLFVIFSLSPGSIY